MNYQSPIEMIMTEARIQVENDIMKSVQNVGINVDKEELTKALLYDRHQYEKGFQDGYRQAKIELEQVVDKERYFFKKESETE